MKRRREVSLKEIEVWGFHEATACWQCMSFRVFYGTHWFYVGSWHPFPDVQPTNTAVMVRHIKSIMPQPLYRGLSKTCCAMASIWYNWKVYIIRSHSECLQSLTIDEIEWFCRAWVIWICHLFLFDLKQAFYWENELIFSLSIVMKYKSGLGFTL